MSRFQPIDLVWNGKTYTIPANRMLGAIARIEEHLTLSELADQQGGGKSVRVRVPLVKLSMAFAAVLEYAGAKGVDAEEVYCSIFEGGDTAGVAQTSVMALLQMMAPPESIVAGGGAAATPGKRVSKPSRRPTSKRSGRAG